MNETQSFPEVMDVKEAAQFLKLRGKYGYITIQRKCHAKEIIAQKVGKEWRIHIDSVRAYLKGQLYRRNYV